jgi:ketosteroid isomerase-like protein
LVGLAPAHFPKLNSNPEHSPIPFRTLPCSTQAPILPKARSHETAASSVSESVGNAPAQTVPPLDKIQNQQELDRAVTALDAALFDAYNRCDLDKFASFFVDDVEFYHDQGGVTLGKAALTDSVKKNICGKVTRELVPGSLKAYPMKGYGALELGVHRFHHPGHEDTEGVGEGQFVHLWQYKDGAWKITRVISYDHHAAGN